PAADAQTAAAPQHLRHRLDAIEGKGHAGFVMRQDQAFRQDIGDKLDEFDGDLLERNRAVEVDLFIRSWPDDKPRFIAFVWLIRTDDQRPKPVDQGIFGGWRDV